MKRINLFWIIWIFITLESKDVACVSYPGVYRTELPVIVPGASPIENVFVTERYGINYECIETCYPILNICDDKCSVMPDLPECLQCQRLPIAHPTPIIIETPPYEPRPPSFEHPPPPIVSYPSRLPRPSLISKPNRPNRPIVPQPPRPIIPEIPRPQKYEDFELLPPTPILPDIPQPPTLEIFEPDLPDLPPVPVPPEVENFETDIHPQVTVPNVPHVIEHFQPEPPKPILSVVPRPPKLETKIPLLPNLPEVPRPSNFLRDEHILHEIPLPIQSIVPELPRPPQFEIALPPQPVLPDVPDSQVYFEFQLLKPDFPHTMFPDIPLPPQHEDFEEDFPIPEVPFITIHEPTQISVIQPVLPEIRNPTFVQIPNPISPERPIIVTTYPENILFPENIQSNHETEDAGRVVDKGSLQPPIVNEYQDICNDYCLLKRNISECEICLKGGVPAHHLELCSNCLVNPSEPDCELCYPILLNLCREFCIFEENEPDCSSCYPQLLVPIFLTEEFVNIPTPILPTKMEYVPIMAQEICSEFCVLKPTSPECEGCGLGVEVVEKICVDICSGYCLDRPDDEQCAVCYATDVEENHEVIIGELPTLEIINFQCCYGDYCTPMPRNGMCPVVCKEQCKTACSDDCFNPTCPDCQELVALNEFRRTQFMIWLKSKLSDMKSRYMAMIEACIRRTELMYERELQAIELEVDTSFLLA